MLRKIGIATVIFVLLIVIGYIQLDDLEKGVKVLQKINIGHAEGRVTTKAIQENTETKLQQEERITKEELEETLKTTPAFQELPEEALITLGFFDGNGNEITDQYFTIAGKEVKEGEAQNPDFVIISGNYWIPKIRESNDFCQVFKEIKETKDYRLERNIGIFQAAIKYRNLLQFEDCVK